MAPSAFERLAPFIKEFVYRQGWDELRSVQVAACDVLFNTDSNLLLASGTASGKTEAAFLPVLTMLHEDPPESIGALYIGPLKALINDQFERLSFLLEEAGIPVTPWHGDVAASKKSKVLKLSRGILQITPESMEGMFLYRSNQLTNLFQDLRFVVIDEVHAFMGSERGRQVLCHLERLKPYLKQEPRRIGLSATLGDYSLAENWLGSGSARGVITPQVGDASRQVRLAVEHFFLPENADNEEETGDLPDKPPEASANNAESVVTAAVEALDQQQRPTSEVPAVVDPVKLRDAFSAYIWHETYGRNKVLVFSNSRTGAEETIAALRKTAERHGLPDDYHVHHGSISKELREGAEEAMRDPLRRSVTAATVTLELGIDIGQLDRVIQLGSPNTVGSFVQRLGRSGRRGQPAEMCICNRETLPQKGASWMELIPWSLLQTIAIIQLYVEERWIEPIPPRKLPYSLLYHQTLSILASQGEMSPAMLAQRVLGLSVFRGVSKEEFRHLLQHLTGLDHLEVTPEGGLIVGLAAERIVNSYRFLAVFKDQAEFSVKDGPKEIGSLTAPVPEGERFRLAGRTWEVLQIDLDRRIIYVRRVRGAATVTWFGGVPDIHTRVLQRMRRVITEDQSFSYLQPNAVERLRAARSLAQQVGILEHNLLPLAVGQFVLLPWLGTKEFETLTRLIEKAGESAIGQKKLQIKEQKSPHYLVLTSNSDVPTEVVKLLKRAIERPLEPLELTKATEDFVEEKYDEFVPPGMLRRAYAVDQLNTEAVRLGLRELR